MIVRELIAKLGFKTDQAQLKKANKGFSNLKGSLLKLGGIAASAAAAVSAVIIPAAQLEDKLREALILTGETGKAFDKLNKDMTNSAQDLSDQLGVAATDVAEGFYQVLSTGAEAMSPQFNAVSQTAIKFAKTIGISVASSVERINDTLNAFQLEGTEAERVADVFFTTSKLAATTVPQLAAAMRDAAPAAATMGISLEETSAILATMAQKGIKGAQAGTAFRQIMLKLAKPTKEGERALKKFETRIFDASGKTRDIVSILKDLQKGLGNMTEKQKAANLKALVGEEAFSRLAAILNSNLDITAEYVEKNKEAAGSLDLAFSQRVDTAVQKLEKMKVSLKNLASEGGEPFLDSVTDSAQSLTEFIQLLREFLEMSPGFMKFLKIIGGIFGFLAKWFTPIGQLGRAISGLTDDLREMTLEAAKLRAEEFGFRLPQLQVAPAGGPSILGARPGAGPALRPDVRNEFKFDLTIQALPGTENDELVEMTKTQVRDVFSDMMRNARSDNQGGGV